MADNITIKKIFIFDPTLASIIHRFNSSPSNVDGHLIGHVARLPPLDLHNDDPSSTASTVPTANPSPLSTIITGIFYPGSPMGLYDTLSNLDLPALHHTFVATDHRSPSCSLLRWFSGCYRSPVHPSTHDISGSPHPDLPPKPCIFLLALSKPCSPHHEYQAFMFRSTVGGSGALEPRSLDTINVSPTFQGQYSFFSLESTFPWMPCWPKGIEEGERERGSKKEESLQEAKRELKLEGLARLMEKTFARVLDL